jgi:hypothetical protein
MPGYGRRCEGRPHCAYATSYARGEACRLVSALERERSSTAVGTHPLPSRACLRVALVTLGVNRGPSTAFAVLRALGWTDEAALALLKSKRPPVNVAYRADANAAITAVGCER